MFGMSKKRMRVAITSFRSGGDAFIRAQPS